MTQKEYHALTFDREVQMFICPRHKTLEGVFVLGEGKQKRVFCPACLGDLLSQVVPWMTGLEADKAKELAG